MKRVLHFGGVVLFTWGAIIIAFSVPRFTGFAIAHDGAWAISVLGLAFMFCGGMLLMSAREEENELVKTLRLYDKSGGKRKDHDNCYVMEDEQGPHTLGEFKVEIEKLRRDQDGEDLVGLLREEFTPSLKAAVQNEAEAAIAWEFLAALGERRPKESEYQMSKTERREIITSFREWHGVPTTDQRQVLARYNLVYAKNDGPHPKIIFQGTGYSMAVAKTPSDSAHGGQNMAHAIIKLIENARNNKFHKPDKEEKDK